jgi:exodeoxyribonuclease V alpha subunit
VEHQLNRRAWYELGKISQALTKDMVRSKSEVIIANLLHDRNISFRYEVKLIASDGTMYLPDFTIPWRGETWYWEHVGMLYKPSYAKRWDRKKVWYKRHFPGRLLVTYESATLSRDSETIIAEIFR